MTRTRLLGRQEKGGKRSTERALGLGYVRVRIRVAIGAEQILCHGREMNVCHGVGRTLGRGTIAQ